MESGLNGRFSWRARPQGLSLWLRGTGKDVENKRFHQQKTWRRFYLCCNFQHRRSARGAKMRIPSV